MKRIIILILTVAFLLSGIGALAEYGAVVNNNANYYGDSSMKHVIFEIPKYTSVVVESVKNGKANIIYDGESVWIKSKYLSYPWKEILKKYYGNGTETYDDTGVYAKKSCYIYEYPETLGTQKSKVKKNTVFIACGEKNGWVLVVDQNQKYYGYIRASNLGNYAFGDATRRSTLHLNYFNVWPFK